MPDNNIKSIMIALNNILTNTVWVNDKREIVSLSDKLQSGIPCIEELDKGSLIGAYVSLQIRTDNFDISADTLTQEELAKRVKEMIFSEAKKLMDEEQERETKVA